MSIFGPDKERRILNKWEREEEKEEEKKNEERKNEEKENNKPLFSKHSTFQIRFRTIETENECLLPLIKSARNHKF